MHLYRYFAVGVPVALVLVYLAILRPVLNAASATSTAALGAAKGSSADYIIHT